MILKGTAWKAADPLRAKDAVRRQRVGGSIPLEELTRVSRTRATSVAFHNKAELCSLSARSFEVS